MPRTVREALGGNLMFAPPAAATRSWTPAPCPSLAGIEPWADHDAPWREPVTDWPVDRARTHRLDDADVDVPVGLSGPGQVWAGSVAGIPFHVVDQEPSVAQTVTDLGLPAKVHTRKHWIIPGLWGIDVPERIEFPNTAVTMPAAVVRREGDPHGAWDRHALFLNPSGRRLVEMIQLEHGGPRAQLAGAEWTCGHDGGSGLAVWDLDQPWNSPTQPLGVVASKVPFLPHILRADELRAGRVEHALFCVPANYGRGHTGYARGSDGSLADHPLRAGERLRLRPEHRDRAWSEHTHPAQRAVIDALATVGMIIGDRRGKAAGTDAPAGITCAQDPHLDGLGLDRLRLRLSHFDVVHNP